MLYKALNRRYCGRILNIMLLEVPAVDPTLAQTGAPYRFELLPEAALQAFTGIPENNLDRHFVADAYRRGDRCCGFIDGEKLAGFMWYATRPTEISNDLVVDFPPQYTYVYHGYTCPGYRGQGLFRLIFDRILRSRAEMGSQGLVCYVEGNNFTSRRAMERTGFRRIGRVWIFRIAGRYLLRHDRGCQNFGFRIRPKKTKPAAGRENQR